MLPYIGSSTGATRNAMGFWAHDNRDAFFAGKRPRDLLWAAAFGWLNSPTHRDHLLPDDDLLLLGINLAGISFIFVLVSYTLCQFAHLLWLLRGNQMLFFHFRPCDAGPAYHPV